MVLFSTLRVILSGIIDDIEQGTLGMGLPLTAVLGLFGGLFLWSLTDWSVIALIVGLFTIATIIVMMVLLIARHDRHRQP